MTRVLVTGASGFVGSVLCGQLVQAGYVVRAALRADRGIPECAPERVTIGDVAAPHDLNAALKDVDFVVHLAARTHVLHDSRRHDSIFDAVNARGTAILADAAASRGVKRFVYVSSVKVNGEESTGAGYSARDTPRPRDAYGVSKWEGEKYLMGVAERSSMEATIVRPPLVYGPGVRGNFLRLLRMVDREWPLPLGLVRNNRSLVSVWNLCGLLLEVMRNPAAPGHTWMVSDADALSTPELIRRIAKAMNRRARLLRVPVPVLSSCGWLIGRQGDLARLTGSLVVDMASTRESLGWSPPIGTEEALARTVSWYSNEERPRVA